LEEVKFIRNNANQIKNRRSIKKIRKQNKKRKINKHTIRKKKNASKISSDYKKNICGYIVKKVMR
jgi:hypothetical protein